MRLVHVGLFGLGVLSLGACVGGHADVPDDAGPAPLALARVLAGPSAALREILAPHPDGFQKGPNGYISGGFARGPADVSRALGTVAPSTAADALRTGTRQSERYRVSLTLEGASATARPELADGTLVYRDALVATDEIVAASDTRSEALLLLHSAEAPRVFTWRLELGEALVGAVTDGQGGLNIEDHGGNTVFHVPAPFAVDAAGRQVGAELRYDDLTKKMHIALNFSGLTFPVALDPTIESWVWTPTPITSAAVVDGRRFAAATYDPVHNQVDVYGGMAEDGRLLDSLAVLDLASNRWVDIAPGGVRPPPLALATMGFDAELGVVTLVGGTDHLPGASDEEYVASEQVWEWDGRNWRTAAPLPDGPGGYLATANRQPTLTSWSFDAQQQLIIAGRNSEPQLLQRVRGAFLPSAALRGVAPGLPYSAGGGTTPLGNCRSGLFLKNGPEPLRCVEAAGTTFINDAPPDFGLGTWAPLTALDDALLIRHTSPTMTDDGLEEQVARMDPSPNATWEPLPNMQPCSANRTPVVLPTHEVLLVSCTMHTYDRWDATFDGVHNGPRTTPLTFEPQAVRGAAQLGGKATLIWDPQPFSAVASVAQLDATGTWRNAGLLPNVAVATAFDSKRQRLVTLTPALSRPVAVSATSTTELPSPTLGAGVSQADLDANAEAFAAAYDSARDQIVYFDGTRLLVWSFASNAVTAPTMGALHPPARHGHALAFDAARMEIVLFGGANLSDTWTWNGTTWTDRTTAYHPPPRTDHTLAYSASTHSVVLFGGNIGVTSMQDAWAWHGTSWSSISAGRRPSPRARHAMFDDGTGAMTLVGGQLSPISAAYTNDVWTLKPLGGTCKDETACGGARCVDGVCCVTAQCGTCETCNGTSPGRCSPVQNREDTDSCAAASGKMCNDLAVCTATNGVSCTKDTECASGYCTDGVCCNVRCEGACLSCASNLAGNVGQCLTAKPSEDPSCGQQCLDGATNCHGFLCKDRLSCRDSCDSVVDCAKGFVCAGHSCILPPDDPPANDTGCAIGGARATSAWPWSTGALCTLFMIAWRRRARRKPARSATASRSCRGPRGVA